MMGPTNRSRASVLLVGGLCLFPVTGHLRATEAPAAAVQQRGPEPSPETAF